MKLIAQKPCSFDGKKFYIGDEIPVESVVAPETQAKMGVLAIVTDGGTPAGPKQETVYLEKIPVVIHQDGQDISLEPTKEGVQQVFDVLNATAEEAAVIVSGMTDGDALILLHATDKRKGMKDEYEKRAKAISEEVGEQ